jgi:cytochrome c-type biogenesis protein CcmH
MKSMLLALLMSCWLFSTALLAFEPREFDHEQQGKDYRTLIHELRCLVCQGQNIADSNAPLAQDMRNLVYRQLRDGQTAEEVRNHMISRYGDTISLRPPVKQNTALLWGLPPLLLFVGALVLWRAIASRQPSDSSS